MSEDALMAIAALVGLGVLALFIIITAIHHHFTKLTKAEERQMCLDYGCGPECQIDNCPVLPLAAAGKYLCRAECYDGYCIQHGCMQERLAKARTDGPSPDQVNDKDTYYSFYDGYVDGKFVKEHGLVIGEEAWLHETFRNAEIRRALDEQWINSTP